MKSLLVILIFNAITSSTQLLANSKIPLPIINFLKVNDILYRGARLTSSASIQYLASLHIKSVINLQGGDLDSDIGSIIPWAEPGETPENIAHEKTMTVLAALEFFHAPLNSLAPITNAEDHTIDETLDFMSNKNNQPIFIHCEHGLDRTGLIVALYRVKYEHMDIEAARSEWIKNGHSRFRQFFTGHLDEYYYKKVQQFQ